MSQTEVQLIKDAVIVNADVSGSAAIDVSKISGAMPLAGGSFTDDVTFTGASANIVFDKSDNSLEFADDAMATFGGSADLRIRHNGNNSLIEDMGTGNLQIRGDDVHITGTNDEILAKFIENTGVELYHDGSSKKFQTYTSGIQFFGNIKNETDGTNQGMFLGAANDFQFYHDGTRSAINNRTGDLRLLGAGNIKLGRADSGNTTDYNETYISCNSNGAVELYNDNEKMFQTNNDGSEFFDSDSNLNIYFSTNGTTRRGYIFAESTGGGKISFYDPQDHPMLSCTKDAAVELYYDNTKRLETLSDGAQCKGVMHVMSEDGNVIQTTQAFYHAIGTNSSATFTLTSLIGSGRFVAGGYANAGQGALAVNIMLGGAMFATQHYNVNELQTSGMQNISVSTSKNNTSYVVTISNGSSSSTIGVSGFVESTGNQMGLAIA